jgi:hypothetical protein
MTGMDDEPPRGRFSPPTMELLIMANHFTAEAARQRAKALSRWEGEGGALGPALEALDDADMRILARLGAGLLLRWDDVPDPARRAVVAMASTLHAEKDAERIKREIERFLDGYEDR